MTTNDSKDQGRDDMMLPQGRICGDCASFNTCKGLFGCEPGNTRCDFSPSRFMIKIEAAIATSASALARDEASVALTDELPGATAALRDLLRAKDLPNEQGALARVRGENMQKAWEHARALLAASSAATVSDEASVGAECSHRIVDARNEVVKSGYLCIDCGALFTGIHPTATVSDAASVQGWEPEILTGPCQNVCWTQDMVPRAERINAVVISEIDYQRICAALAVASSAATVSDAASVQDGYAFRSDGKLWVVTDADVAMKWQEQGFEVTPVIAAATAGAQDERAAFEELRGQMAYIAAYSPDEADSMSKDRLAGRLRAIIERARKAMGDFRAASSATAPLTSDSDLATDTERLDFMLANDAFTVRCNRDGSILQYQLMTQDEDENYHVLHNERRFFNTERDAIDEAIRCAQSTNGEQS